MKPDQKLLAALAGQKSHVPPIWLMRQAGRYLPEYKAVRAQAGGFIDLCLNPALAAEVTLQPVRRFDMDAAILFSDILMVPYGLGQNLWFAEGEGPRLTPLSSMNELAPEKILPRLAPIFETVRRVRQALSPEKSLIGFAGGLFTVAAYMLEGKGSREFSALRLRAYRDPLWVEALFADLTEATVAYLSAQIEAGADSVQIFDSWAGLLPASEFHRWVILPTARLVTKLRARHPAIPIIGFPRGAGALYEDYARKTGVTALGLDTSVPLDFARRLQKIVPVQGNLDPLCLVAGGDSLRRAVAELRRALDDGPFIFNLGHGIVPETPPDHVLQLVQAARTASSQPPN